MGYSYSKEGYYQYKDEDPRVKKLKRFIIIAVIILIILTAIVLFFAFGVHNPDTDSAVYLKNDIEAIKEEINNGTFDPSPYYPD